MSAPDPQVAWQVVLTLGVLLTLAAQGYSLIRDRRRSGQQESQDREWVSHKHCQLVEQRWRDRINAVEGLARTNSGRIDGLSSTVSQQLNDLRRELKEDNERTHRRIDQILAAVSELKGETKHLQPHAG